MDSGVIGAKRFALWGNLGAALLLTACSSGQDKQADTEQGGEPTQVASSYYRTEIAPLLQSNCATCHLTGQEAGGMSLIPDKAVATLVNVKALGAPKMTRVVPGDPDNSYIIMKLEGTHIEKGGVGAQMPFGAAPLSPEKIAKIRKWIAEGAKE